MRIRTILAAAAAMLALISCKPNIFIDEFASEGGEFTFPEEGGTQTWKFRAVSEGRWSIVNYASEWLYITPTVGLAGDIAVTATADPNNGTEDRNGSVYVLDGTRTLEFKVIQPCKRMIMPESFEYFVSSDACSLKIHVDSKVSYEISCDSPWVSCPDVSFSESADLLFQIKANNSADSREAVVTFTSKGVPSVGVTIMQSGKINVNWDADFYRSILGYRFTGDWCGWCPGLAYDINQFVQKNPGRFNYICIYDQNSDVKLKYDKCAKYQNRFGINSWPSLVLDQRALATGMTSPKFETAIKSFCDEEKANFKPVTAISAQVSVSGSQISVHPTVFAKEAGTYHLHVVLLENGVVVKQSNYTELYTETQANNWKHNNVVREFLTPVLTGEEFTAAAKSSNIFNYSSQLPYNIYDKSKLSVAIYVTRAVQNGPSSVYGLSYYKSISDFVDNSVMVNAGESVELKYE